MPPVESLCDAVEAAQKDSEQSILRVARPAESEGLDAPRDDGAPRVAEADRPVAAKERVLVLVFDRALGELAHRGG